MIDARTQHNATTEYQADTIKKAANACGSRLALSQIAGVSYDYLSKLSNGTRKWTFSLQCLIERIASEDDELTTVTLGAGTLDTDALKEQGIKVSRKYFACPNIEGGMLGSKSECERINQYPACYILPVSQLAAYAEDYRRSGGVAGGIPEELDWIVVAYKGHGIAMTVLEASRLGLNEEPNWFPELP